MPVLTATSDSTFRFKATDSSSQNVYYKGLGKSGFDSFETTFVTERGSKVTSIGTSDVRFNVAKKIGQPTFNFAYAGGVVATDAANDYTMGIGESKVFGGVTVKVKTIDATSGSCNVLGPGGVPQCTVDATGVTGIISPNNAATVQAVQPFKLAEQLVYLDTEGASSGVSIIVGGPMVNSLAGTDIVYTPGTVVVKEVGNKILIAGYSAQDTMAAAAEFIANIKRQ